MNNVDTLLKLANDYHDNCLAIINATSIEKVVSGKYCISTNNTKELDLSDVEDFGYSAFMRKFRQRGSKDQVRNFLEIYKKNFDKAVKDKVQKPEKIALQNTILKLNKLYSINLPKKMIKKAAITELGDPVQVGEYLANIVKFILNRISTEKRVGATQRIREKLYALDEGEIGSKNMPASSAMGQSITFVKHVLFNHDPHYIREVLNNLVRHL